MKWGLLVFLAIVFIVIFGCTIKEKPIEQKIKERLVGEKIIYYNIAGQPINFTISAEDITSIEKIQTKEGVFWKARVGKELMWDLYLDKNGEIVKKEQLFVT